MLVGMVLNTDWFMHCHCKLITTKILNIKNKLCYDHDIMLVGMILNTLFVARHTVSIIFE